MPKLNYNANGWEIAAEEITVPSSAPYQVRLEHDNVTSPVEIWSDTGKEGTELTEEPFTGTVSGSGKFQVDYEGTLDFRKSTILFHEAQAGTRWYVWYKTLGDIPEADDINELDTRIDVLEEQVEGIDGRVDGVEGQISQLSAEIEDLEDRVEVLESTPSGADILEVQVFL